MELGQWEIKESDEHVLFGFWRNLAPLSQLQLSLINIYAARLLKLINVH